MPKDREQATPDEPEDRSNLHPRRSAAKEATEDFAPAGDEHGRSPGDPRAIEEVAGEEKRKYE